MLSHLREKYREIQAQNSANVADKKHCTEKKSSPGFKRPHQNESKAVPHKKKKSVICQLAKTVFVHEDEEIDILSWWTQHRELYPVLFKMVASTMCVPASTAASEGKFSLVKFIIDGRRSNVSNDKIDDILLLKSSFDNELL